MCSLWSLVTLRATFTQIFNQLLSRLYRDQVCGQSDFRATLDQRSVEFLSKLWLNLVYNQSSVLYDCSNFLLLLSELYADFVLGANTWATIIQTTRRLWSRIRIFCSKCPDFCAFKVQINLRFGLWLDFCAILAQILRNCCSDHVQIWSLIRLLCKPCPICVLLLLSMLCPDFGLWSHSKRSFFKLCPIFALWSEFCAALALIFFQYMSSQCLDLVSDQTLCSPCPDFCVITLVCCHFPHYLHTLDSIQNFLQPFHGLFVLLLPILFTNFAMWSHFSRQGEVFDLWSEIWSTVAQNFMHLMYIFFEIWSLICRSFLAQIFMHLLSRLCSDLISDQTFA